MTEQKKSSGNSIKIVFAIIVIIGVIAGIAFGYFYSSGKELQEKQTKLWEEAFTCFSQNQPEAAYLKLLEVRSTFNESLDFYRSLASDTFLTKQEVNEAVFLICQSEAYDNLFKLESAEDWLNKAKSEIENFEDEEAKSELVRFVSRAEAANNFCKTYNEYIKNPDLKDEQYQELVKNSLKVGTEAISSNDYDYTIFEVRFLIACGKSFKEPILVSEARKQLFNITKNTGEDEKTKLLWSLLKN